MHYDEQVYALATPRRSDNQLITDSCTKCKFYFYTSFIIIFVFFDHFFFFLQITKNSLCICKRQQLMVLSIGAVALLFRLETNKSFFRFSFNFDVAKMIFGLAKASLGVSMQKAFHYLP